MAANVYIIKYSAFDKHGSIIKKGIVKARNKINELEAEVNFEIYLRKQHSDFKQLVIHRCEKRMDVDAFLERVNK